MRNILGITILIPCLLAAPASFGQTPASSTTLTQNPVFQKNCAKCHGKAAEGRHFAGPSLVSAKTLAMSEDELREIIVNGRHRMPKFTDKLTAEEINSLVQEIKSANPK